MANEATLEMIVRAQDQATRTLKQTESLLRSLGGAVTGGVTAPFRVASGVVGGFVHGMGQIGLAAMGIKATVSAVKSLTGGLIAGNAEFERYQTQFEVLLGSADAAKKKLQDLAQFGATTPFELPEVVRASKTLQVFGGEALNTMKNLRLVGDIAAGVGRPFENVAFWVGRLYSNLKGGKPIGEAAMALQEMGAMSGELRAKLEKLFKDMQNGKATAEDVFKAFVEGMREQFGGMMEKQSQTFEGMMSNLVDWWENTKRIIAEPIFDVVKQNLGNLLDFLGSEQVMQATQRFAEYLAAGIQTAMEWLQKAVGVVHGVADALRAAFGDMSFATEIGDYIGEALHQIFGLEYGAKSALYELLTAFTSTFAAIGVAAKSLVDTIVAILQGDFGRVSSIWQERWGTMRYYAEIALGSVRDLTGMAVEAISQRWPVLGVVFAKVSDAIGVARDAFSTALETMRSVVDSVVTHVTDAWPTIQSVAMTVLGAVVAEIGQAVDFVRANWPLVRDTIAAVMDTVSAVVSDVLSRVVTWWIENGAQILASVQAIYTQVQTFVQEAIAFISEIVGSGLEIVRGWWEQHGVEILTTVQTTYETIRLAIEEAIGYISEVVSSGLEGIRAWWDENGTNVIASVQTAYETIYATVEEWIGQTQAFIESALAEIEGYWQTNGDNIITTAISTYENVRATVEQYIWQARDNISQTLEQIRTFWEQHGNEVQAFVLSFLAAVSDIFQSALSGIMQAVGDTLGLLRDWWNEHGESVKTIIQAALVAIVAIVGGLMKLVTEVWTRYGEDIKRVTSEVWDLVKVIIESVLGIIGGILDAFAALIKGDWKAFGDALKDIWSNIWTAIKTILVGAKDILIAVIRGLVNAAKNAFTNVDWGSVGRAIVDGVAAGVRAGAGAIADAARSAAQAALDAAKSLLGIRSPSRVFMELGEQTMAGFVQGILKHMDTITSVIRQTFGKVSDESVKQVSNISSMLSAAGRAVNETIRAITTVAEFDVGKTAVGGRGMERARWVARRMAKILQELANVIRVEWVQAAAKLAAAHAGNIRKAFEPIRTVIEAIKAVASLDIEKTAVGLRSSEKAYYVARRMAEILRQLWDVVRVEWVQGAAKLTAEHSENIRKALEPVRVVVEAIKSVASIDVEATAVGLRSGEKAKWVARRMAEILRQMDAVIRVEWVQEAAKSVAANAEEVRKALEPVRVIVEAIKSVASLDIEETAVGLQAGNKAYFMARRMAEILRQLGEVAQVEWVQNAARYAADLAENAQNALKLVTVAIDAMVAIAEYQPAKNMEEKMKVFRSQVEMFFADVLAIRRSAGEDALPAAQELLEIANAIRDSVIAAIDSLRAVIENSDGLKGAPALFRRVIEAFQQLVENMRHVGYNMGRTWLIGIENGLRSRLDNLEALLEYIRGLFPSSPAKHGPFRTLPDWGALLNGFDEALALATAGARELAAVPSPAFAAARGGAGIAGRGSGNIVVNITYSPGISLADRREVEERIAPLIEEALRRARRKRL